jgi:hypothetical protein
MLITHCLWQSVFLKGRGKTNKEITMNYKSYSFLLFISICFSCKTKQTFEPVHSPLLRTQKRELDDLNILGVVKFTELLSKLNHPINRLFRFIGSIISAIINSRMHYNGNPKQTLNFQLYDA